jgi:hypothetical protein
MFKIYGFKKIEDFKVRFRVWNCWWALPWITYPLRAPAKTSGNVSFATNNNVNAIG